MSRTFRLILWTCVPLIALIGAWRLWSAATSAPSGPEGLAGLSEQQKIEAAREIERLQRETEERRTATESWLNSRRPHVGPVVGPGSFEVLHAVERARPQYQALGLGESDVRAAVRHAGELLYLMYVRCDCDALTSWRLAYGYRYFPIERLKADRHMRRHIEHVAGRSLGPEETDTLALWRDYCRQRLQPGRPQIRGLDLAPDGALVLVHASRRSLAVRAPEVAPFRLNAPSQIGHSVDDPQAPALLRTWAGVEGRIVWPTWFPPADVEPRLQREGTIFAEVAYVLLLDDGSLQPISIVLGLDPVTRRWWVMQCYILHNNIRPPRTPLPLALGGF